MLDFYERLAAHWRQEMEAARTEGDYPRFAAAEAEMNNYLTMAERVRKQLNQANQAT